jgi:hypothetical protein
MVENDSQTLAWETPERPSATRREWIRSAGSGLLMATGGLFLPQWLEEAKARPEGALGGQLGGRHGNNRRGRDNHKRRNHKRNDAKRQKNKDGTPRGAPHVLWIKFYVYNDRPVTTPNQSASVRGWANENGEPGEQWDRLPLVSVPNGAYTGEFEMFEYKEGAVVMDDRYYVEADNTIPFFVPPAIRLYYGGTMTEQGYQGGTIEVDALFLKEDQQFERTIEGHRFTIKRLYDTNDYKVFDIHFT